MKVERLLRVNEVMGVGVIILKGQCSVFAGPSAYEGIGRKRCGVGRHFLSLASHPCTGVCPLQVTLFGSRVSG